MKNGVATINGKGKDEINGAGKGKEAKDVHEKVVVGNAGEDATQEERKANEDHEAKEKGAKSVQVLAKLIKDGAHWQGKEREQGCLDSDGQCAFVHFFLREDRAALCLQAALV